MGCKLIFSPNILKTMPYCVQGCPENVKKNMFLCILKWPCHFGYFDYDTETRLWFPVCQLSNFYKPYVQERIAEKLVGWQVFSAAQDLLMLGLFIFLCSLEGIYVPVSVLIAQKFRNLGKSAPLEEGCGVNRLRSKNPNSSRPNNCMFWAVTEAEGEVGYP